MNNPWIFILMNYWNFCELALPNLGSKIQFSD